MNAQRPDVRPAAPGEEDRIADLYEWLFAAPGVRPARWDPGTGRERLRAAIDGPQSTVLVADDGGALVGFCTAYLDLVSVRFGPRCWVEDLATDPGRRSQGIGSALLEAAKAWARDAGATHLELDSALARAGAHRFYEREGGSRQSFVFGWEL
jgi:GNAT superfamily N-acetyltransferase